jgi:DNA-binding HxlR family transcriptional regulator
MESDYRLTSMHLLVSIGKTGDIMSNEPFTCGLDAALAVIGGKWKPLILYYLAHATRRYGALKRCVRGVSDKMLIQQLKEMEADGVVDRTNYKEIPPRVDYSLTPFGRSLARSLAPLCAWGEEHSAAIAAVVGRRNGDLMPIAAGKAVQSPQATHRTAND